MYYDTVVIRYTITAILDPPKRKFFKKENTSNFLVDEAEDLAGNVLATSLLVVHNTSRGGQDNVTELTRGKEIGDPLLNVVNLDVETGRDNADLVKTTVELDNDLARAVVINELEVVNVA